MHTTTTDTMLVSSNNGHGKGYNAATDGDPLAPPATTPAAKIPGAGNAALRGHDVPRSDPR